MRNSDYKAYHESVAIELLASRNRVRYFIGSSNWPEDGRFKEMLLMNYLKKKFTLKCIGWYWFCKEWGRNHKTN